MNESEFELKNLMIRDDFFFKMGLPFYILEGQIRKILIKVPLIFLENLSQKIPVNYSTKPGSISIEGVNARVIPLVDRHEKTVGRPHAEEKHKGVIAEDLKSHMLARWEKGIKNYFDSFGKEENTSSIAKLIIQNLQVSLKGLSIYYYGRLEQKATRGITEESFVLKIHVDEVTKISTNSDWKDAFVKSTEQIYSKVIVKGISVCINHFRSGETEELRLNPLRKGGLGTVGKLFPDVEARELISLNNFVLWPLTVECRVSLDTRFKVDFTQSPLSFAGIEIKNMLLVSINPIQLNAISVLVKQLKNLETIKKHLHLRPNCPIKGKHGVKEWWQYAGRVIREYTKERFAWMKVSSVSKLMTIYIDLYKRSQEFINVPWLSRLSPTETKKLKKIEKTLTARLLIEYRKFAIIELKIESRRFNGPSKPESSSLGNVEGPNQLIEMWAGDVPENLKNLFESGFHLSTIQNALRPSIEKNFNCSLTSKEKKELYHKLQQENSTGLLKLYLKGQEEKPKDILARVNFLCKNALLVLTVARKNQKESWVHHPVHYCLCKKCESKRTKNLNQLMDLNSKNEKKVESSLGSPEIFEPEPRNKISIEEKGHKGGGEDEFFDLGEEEEKFKSFESFASESKDAQEERKEQDTYQNPVFDTEFIQNEVSRNEEFLEDSKSDSDEELKDLVNRLSPVRDHSSESEVELVHNPHKTVGFSLANEHNHSVKNQKSNSIIELFGWHKTNRKGAIWQEFEILMLFEAAQIAMGVDVHRNETVSIPKAQKCSIGFLKIFDSFEIIDSPVVKWPSGFSEESFSVEKTSQIAGSSRSIVDNLSVFVYLLKSYANNREGTRLEPKQKVFFNFLKDCCMESYASFLEDSFNLIDYTQGTWNLKDYDVNYFLEKYCVLGPNSENFLHFSEQDQETLIRASKKDLITWLFHYCVKFVYKKAYPRFLSSYGICYFYEFYNYILAKAATEPISPEPKHAPNIRIFLRSGEALEQKRLDIQKINVEIRQLDVRISADTVSSLCEEMATCVFAVPIQKHKNVLESILRMDDHFLNAINVCLTRPPIKTQYALIEKSVNKIRFKMTLEKIQARLSFRNFHGDYGSSLVFNAWNSKAIVRPLISCYKTNQTGIPNESVKPKDETKYFMYHQVECEEFQVAEETIDMLNEERESERQTLLVEGSMFMTQQMCFFSHQPLLCDLSTRLIFPRLTVFYRSSLLSSILALSLLSEVFPNIKELFENMKERAYSKLENNKLIQNVNTIELKKMLSLLGRAHEAFDPLKVCQHCILKHKKSSIQTVIYIGKPPETDLNEPAFRNYRKFMGESSLLKIPEFGFKFKALVGLEKDQDSTGFLHNDGICIVIDQGMFRDFFGVFCSDFTPEDGKPNFLKLKIESTWGISKDRFDLFSRNSPENVWSTISKVERYFKDNRHTEDNSGGSSLNQVPLIFKKQAASHQWFEIDPGNAFGILFLCKNYKNIEFLDAMETDFSQELEPKNFIFSKSNNIKIHFYDFTLFASFLSIPSTFLLSKALQEYFKSHLARHEHFQHQEAPPTQSIGPQSPQKQQKKLNFISTYKTIEDQKSYEFILEGVRNFIEHICESNKSLSIQKLTIVFKKIPEFKGSTLEQKLFEKGKPKIKITLDMINANVSQKCMDDRNPLPILEINQFNIQVVGVTMNFFKFCIKKSRKDNFAIIIQLKSAWVFSQKSDKWIYLEMKKINKGMDLALFCSLNADPKNPSLICDLAPPAIRLCSVTMNKIITFGNQMSLFTKLYSSNFLNRLEKNMLPIEKGDFLAFGKKKPTSLKSQISLKIPFLSIFGQFKINIPKLELRLSTLKNENSTSQEDVLEIILIKIHCVTIFTKASLLFVRAERPEAIFEGVSKKFQNIFKSLHRSEEDPEVLLEVNPYSIRVIMHRYAFYFLFRLIEELLQFEMEMLRNNLKSLTSEALGDIMQINEENSFEINILLEFDDMELFIPKNSSTDVFIHLTCSSLRGNLRRISKDIITIMERGLGNLGEDFDSVHIPRNNRAIFKKMTIDLIQENVYVKEDQIVSFQDYIRQSLMMIEGHIRLQTVRGFISSIDKNSPEKELGGCTEINLEIFSPQKSKYPKFLKWTTKIELKVRVESIDLIYMNILLNLHLKNNLNEPLKAYAHKELEKPWKKLDIKLEIPTISLKSKMFTVDKQNVHSVNATLLQHEYKS